MKARSRTSHLGALALTALLTACGSEAEQVPGPAAPPPSTAAPTATATAAATATVAATTPLPVVRRPLAELQREAMKGMLAAFAAHDPKKIAALYTDDVVSGSPGPLGWMEDRGKGAVESGHVKLFAGFPDMKWMSPRVFVKDDVVIQEWVSNATHTGDMGEMKATGKPTGIHGVSVYWFNEDGLIKKDSTYYDGATIAMQTGSMPGKPRALPALPAGEPTWTTSSGTPEEQKRIDSAKSMYAAFAGKDEKAFLAHLDKDAIHIAYAQPDDKKGQKVAGEGHKAMHKAFPDMKNTVTNIWAFGDKVVAEITMTGTHQGALGPLKATKKPVTLHSLDILTFGKDDKVLSLESYGSSLELLGQLGALDAPTKLDASKKPSAAPKK